MLDKTAPEKAVKVYDKPKQPYFKGKLLKTEEGLAKIQEGSPMDSLKKRKKQVQQTTPISK